MRISAGITMLLCVLLWAHCSAEVIRVPDQQPKIPAGVDAASEGDTVLVADGTFEGPGNVDVSIEDSGVTLISENGPEHTVIDCGGPAPALIAGAATLCAGSPCLPASQGNPWSALVGALGEGCAACGSPVVPESWGGVKSRYREGL
jgi:hypothetical protein